MRPKRCSIFYPYRSSLALLDDATSGVPAGTGVGAPVEGEAGATGAVGLVMTAGDEADWFITLPRDLNWALPVGIRVRYGTASATATDTHTWIVLYDVIAEDAAMAIGTTALDTTIAVDTDNGTADAWQHTPRGVINGNTFTAANVTNQDFLAVNVELDATDAAEEINLYGIMIDYMPKPGLGGPSSFNAEFDQEDM